MEKHDINVAIVVYPPQSGILQYSLELTAELKSRVNLMLFCNVNAQACDKSQIPVKRVFGRTRFFPFYFFVFFFHVIVDRIKVVHIQDLIISPAVSIVLLSLLKLIGVVVIYTAHDVSPNYIPANSYLLRWLYSIPDKVIVHSGYAKQEMMSLGRSHAVHIIPHGLFEGYIVDTDGRLNVDYPFSEEDKVILFFGRVDVRKGILDFLKEFQRLLAKDRRLALWIVGKNTCPPGSVEDGIAKFGLSSRVALHSEWVSNDEVSFFFTKSDAVVLPYLSGTTSGVLKIAMSFKKFVIATKVCEFPEMLAKYKNGVLIDLPMTCEQEASILAAFDTGHSQHFEIPDDFRWPSIAAKTVELYRG